MPSTLGSPGRGRQSGELRTDPALAGQYTGEWTAEKPGQYYGKIYGVQEVGGTNVFYLSAVPFEQIGYITGLPKTPMPDRTHRWLRATAPVFAVLYGVFGALNWIVRRRMRRQQNEGEHS
jgi:hypothetical protein